MRVPARTSRPATACVAAVCFPEKVAHLIGHKRKRRHDAAGDMTTCAELSYVWPLFYQRMYVDFNTK